MKEINRVMYECYWVGQYFRWDTNISYEISLMGRTPERGDLGKGLSKQKVPQVQRL